MASARWAVAAIPGVLTLAACSYPLLLVAGAFFSAFAVHAFFSHICHQFPARSFFMWGAPLAVCARCIGIYAGAAVGAFVAAPRSVMVKALWVALALNLVEAATEYAALHGNWLVVRTLLGFALGISVSALVADATVEAHRLKWKAAG